MLPFSFVLKNRYFCVEIKNKRDFMEFSESGYAALLEEIFQRFPSVQKTDFATAYKPGLAGMEGFCEALGHPERSFKGIHVAGTNGKGSVASILTSALAACGIRTGLYTSPHLIDFTPSDRLPGACPHRLGRFLRPHPQGVCV